MSAKELNDADLDQVQGGAKSKTTTTTTLTSTTTTLGGQKPMGGTGGPLAGSKPRP